MNEAGFVRLSRKFFRSDLWNDHREFSRAEAWLDMIATATWAPETRLVEGRCVNLQRGELAASLRYLATRWSWSKSKVERFLSTLASSGRIRDRIETGTRLITLCNYEHYNPVRDANGTATSPPTGHPPGHHRDKVEEGEEPERREELLHNQTTARAGLAQNPGRPKSLEHVLLNAERIGMAKEAAERFWHHFEASGWIDKNGHPVIKWESKMKTWSENDRAKPAEGGHGHGNGNGATEKILASKELDRIDHRIGVIKSSYDSHQTPSPQEAAELKKLWERKRQLKRQLGFIA